MDTPVRHYLPHEAAEIVRLCCNAGIPEEAELWLIDGYTPAQVADNLRARGRPGAATLATASPPETSSHDDLARISAARFAAYIQRTA
jgi:hypothetical protein